MSRSFKKPYLKIGMPGAKEIGARMERRIVRQLLKPWKHKWVECHGWGCEEQMIIEHWLPWDDNEYEYGHCGFICNCYQFTAPMEPLLPLRKQIINGYDICDYKCYWPKDPQSYRK